MISLHVVGLGVSSSVIMMIIAHIIPRRVTRRGNQRIEFNKSMLRFPAHGDLLVPWIAVPSSERLPE